MGFISEFKAFALRGNVLDMAVGVVIGGAFGKIVSSLVDDIITPAILTPALKAAHLTNIQDLVIPGTGIKYGMFVSNVITFLIVALALFIVIKMINRVNKKQEEAKPSMPHPPSKEEVLLTEIRDILKNNQK
ncbi:MAG: large-conductance mechanosensitive channel [Bacteroidia bacterium]|nr:MAG: large-conductance mechanosensitive channel [Bacteroidia bacterium]